MTDAPASLPIWPYAHGGPVCRAVLRSTPDDFLVDEINAIELSGDGEHLWLRVRKRGQNTAFVAQALARFAGIKTSDVGYAGLKDRHAVTDQWFSLYLPGQAAPDWRTFNLDGVIVLHTERHAKKLQRGALLGNRFELILRDVHGDATAIEGRLQAMLAYGVPNYFGAQRFGRDAGNLLRASALFSRELRERDPIKRGLYLSAARSYLFNLVVAERVRQGCWDTAIPGDAMQLDGSDSFFVTDLPDAEIIQRVLDFDIHPTAPLWGRGRLPTTAACAAMESQTLYDYAVWRDGLEHAGMRQERRSARLASKDLCWRWLAPGVLKVAFFLPAGCFATSFIREFVDTNSNDENADA